MARNSVSKSCLMAELCFHRFVHFDVCMYVLQKIDMANPCYIIYIEISLRRTHQITLHKR